MQISVVTVGEFAEGFPEEKQELCTELLQPYDVIDVSYDVARHYARLSRELRRLGVRTGDNDLWIAATAIQRDVELVTRDAGHFSRIQGLKLVQY